MKILWKLYFYWMLVVVMAVIPVFLIAPFFTDQFKLTSEIVTDLAFAPFAVIGLYGFVYEEAKLKKEFWAIFTIIFLSWHLYGYLTSSEYTMMEIVALVASWGPLYYALISYSFIRKDLWLSKLTT